MEPGVEPLLVEIIWAFVDVPAGIAIGGSRIVSMKGPGADGPAAFGLGERPEAAGFPVPGGDPGCQIGGGGVVLFGEDGAVPGEVDPFAHPAVVAGAIGAIAGEALFGDPPAERIIGIPPAPAVRGGHTGEAIVGIPAVAPGPRFRRQPLVLAHRHPALAVVLVADPAGPANQRAGVLPTTLRGLVHPVAPVTLCGWGRDGHRPGRVDDVARRVVGVTLLPVGSVDGGDPPGRVEIEPAQACEHVIDLADVTVRTVGVVPALQHPRVPRGHGLRQQLVVGIPRLRQHHPAVQAARDLPAGRVVGEPHRPTGGVQGDRPVVHVVLPDTRRSGRRHPPHPPAQHVVRRGDRPAVTRLGQHPTGGVPGERAVGVGVHRTHDTADGVVSERRHTVRGSCLGHVPERIAGEPHALPGTIDTFNDLPGAIMDVGQHPAVEIGLPHQIPGRIVVIPPHQAGRIGDSHQPQLGVIGERQARPVRADPRSRQIKMRVLGTGHPTDCVEVLNQIVFPVIAPPLDRPIRQGPGCGSALDGPGEPGRPTDRVGHRDHPAEPVPLIDSDCPERIGHGNGQASGVARHPPNLTQRIGDRRQPAAVVIGEPGPRPDRIDHRRQVAPVIVGAFPAGTVRLEQRHR